MIRVSRLLTVSAVAAGLAVASMEVAEAQNATRATPPPSAVSAGILPSCPADQGGLRLFSGRHPFEGSLSGAMYGQTFFAGGGGSSVPSRPLAASSSRASASTPGGGPIASPPPQAGGGNAPPAIPADAVVLPPATEEGGIGGIIDGKGGTGPITGEPVGPFEVGPIAAVTPEPGTLLLIGAGLGALAVRRRSRQTRKG